jgi:hypothetical protein
MNDLMMTIMNGSVLEYFDSTRCVKLFYFHIKGFRIVKSVCSYYSYIDVAAKSKDGNGPDCKVLESVSKFVMLVFPGS